MSLINVDAKIGSKSLARRMCKVLPNIIHPDQCAYVKDRLISNAIRTIDDVMWYTRSGVLKVCLLPSILKKPLIRLI